MRFQILVTFTLSTVVVAHWVPTPGHPSAEQRLFLGLQSNSAELAGESVDAVWDVDARDLLGKTPLMWAAIAGDEAVAGRLLRRGARVAARCDAGVSVLGYAAGHGRARIVRGLVAAGARVDQPDILEGTPLHFASAMLALEGARALLDLGAPVDARNSVGATPLMIAAERGAGGGAMVRLLLDRGAEVNAADASGRTAWTRAAAEGDAATLLMLRAAGARCDSVVPPDGGASTGIYRK